MFTGRLTDELMVEANKRVKERDYWLNKLSGEPVNTHFHYDHFITGSNKSNGESEQSKTTKMVTFRFEDELFEQLTKLINGADFRLHMILVAALVILLHKYTGQEDIIVGSPIYKQDVEVEFINTVLPLRSQINENMTFKNLLLQVKQTVAEASHNQNYPMEVLIDKLNLPASGSTFPLFDTAILVRNVHDKRYLHHIQLNMMFSFLRTDECIEGTVEYNPSLYKKATIQRIIEHLRQLCTKVFFDVDLQMAEIDILTREERKCLLFEFNDNEADFPGDKTVYQFIEAHVTKTPERIAISFDGNQLTYRKLNEQVNQLRQLLRENGIRQEKPVGILLDRSPLMVESILAIWKAGGAYIPIETDYPYQRILEILNDSQADVLLTQSRYVDYHLEQEYQGKMIKFDTLNRGMVKQSDTDADLEQEIDMNGLAYVIYTSGSTGKPKGVMVEHIGMMNHMHAKINDLQLTEKSIIAQNATHTFDISIWQFFTALIPGGKTIIYPHEVILEPEKFISQLIENRITVLEVVPSYLSVTLDFFLAIDHAVSLSLDYLVVTGEEVKPNLVRKWFERFPYIKMVNAYGPTEVSDDITHYIMDKSLDRERIPIGKPLQNLNIYIVDENMILCPIEVSGEICVSGVGVGRGYLNNIEKTRQVFLENPFPKGKGVRLYRTGDVGRWLTDGSIDFLGRKDYQVKIRGFRIELGEIENQLITHPAVKEAVVIDEKDPKGNKYLCAYIVPVGAEVGNKTQFREYLLKKLPEYMVPAHFVELGRIPLTANRKVDRKALPAPEEQRDSIKSPTNKLEKEILDIWSEVLAIDKNMIGIDTNFFELGGHSLKAIVLASNIHKKLNVKIPLAEVFKAQTIRELAAYIEKTAKDRYTSIEPVEKKEYYRLSSAQTRLYVLQQMDLESVGYNMSKTTILKEKPDKEKLEDTINKLIKRHESLRTSYEIVQEEPVQKIHNHVAVEIECYETGEQEARKIAGRFKRPFDLRKAPLLRVGWINVDQTNHLHVLLVDMHHIISDGISAEILVNNFLELYRGEELPPLRIQYRDFSQWQNSEKEKENIKQQEAYWLKEFWDSDQLPVLDLPTDYPRPLLQSFEGNWVSFVFNVRETDILKSIAKENDVTLFMCLLAVFNILFSKLSGQEDIILGVPIIARPHADLQKVIGMLANTLAMRNYPCAHKTFKTFLTEVKHRTLEAYENQEYPFDDLVDKLSVRRDTSRNPVFDVMLNFMNPSKTQVSFDTTGMSEPSSYRHQKGTSKFDMGFHAEDLGKNIYFIIEYCTRLFTGSTIEKFIKYLKTIIRSLSEGTDRKISHIELINTEEKEEILRISNGVEYLSGAHQPIHYLFEAQIERTPDHIALVGPKFQIPGPKSRGGRPPQPGKNSTGAVSNNRFEDNVCISYKELNRKSNQLAHLLRARGVGPNTIVAIMMERSLDMIIGILAILKAGGAYLPIDPHYPRQRILSHLNDTNVESLLTHRKALEGLYSFFTSLKNLGNRPDHKKLVITPGRPQIKNFDQLSIPDRTLVDYEKYHQYVGIDRAKHTISLQATRGCPYNCLYCHKIWPKKHIMRSANHIFEEIRICYKAGAKRFSFVDDIFNLHEKNSSECLKQIISQGLEVQLYFPNGLRGDILTKDFIDLMIEAGTVEICLALETASPRLQKLLGKNLNLERFQENVHYIIRNYPQVVLDLELMLGFPTETEEEALQTLEMLESFKWIHFPDLNVLKIFPNTDMYQFAIENGVTKDSIERSVHLAYQDLPETLPFSGSFARQYQARYMNEYFLLKERLLQVLPIQMKIAAEDELVQKYDSYLPLRINRFSDILYCAGISREELGSAELIQEECMAAPGFDEKIKRSFPGTQKNDDALRILLLDLSLLFSAHGNLFYDLIEEPLGLMALLTYLDKEFPGKILGKIAKSRIDFDNYEELKALIHDFQPQLIGIRTLSYYKEFFHQTVSLIRQWGFTGTIVAGGPYATSDYRLILQDDDVDLVVLGEGELTFAELVGKVMENSNKLPGEDILKHINGLAFVTGKDKNENKTCGKRVSREIILLDEIPGELEEYPGENPVNMNRCHDLFYAIYTSGSTGIPKGVLLEHGNLANLIRYQYKHTSIDFSRVLQFTTICFDVSAQEIFSTLLAGGQLTLVSKEVLRDVPRLFGVVERDDLRTLFLPTSFLKFVMNEPDYIDLIPGSLNHIITAGEQAVINDRFRRYLRDNDVCFHNHYGPSETHVVTALTLYPRGEIPGLPSIGRPVMNTFIYILSGSRHLQPVGVTGELFIGGIQVVRGYLNNPELTIEKFCLRQPGALFEKTAPVREKSTKNFLLKDTGKSYMQSCNHATMQLSSHYPFTPLPHSPIYSTGDLARWKSDGNIEFLGRIDNQVKIRGFRIEPGEIESHLLNHDVIKEAVVLATGDEAGTRNLCAYIVAAGELAVSELRQYLSGKLPDYMIPSYFITLEKIPLTPNGKINRKALPAATLKIPDAYTAPTNKIESKLVDIWSEVLNLNKTSIGLDSNFFELGGHSLKATIVISKIHKELNVKVPLTEIFKTPSIKGLYQYISENRKNKFEAINTAEEIENHPISIEPVEEKEYYPLSSAQKRMFLLQKMEMGTAYNIPQIIVLEGKNHLETIKKTFLKLIKRHESLRTSFEVVNEEPVQKVQSQFTLEIEYSQLSSGSGKRAADIGKREIIKNFMRPFDLSKAPLLRTAFIKMQENKSILLVDMHHIISDGFSLQILRKEFTALYKGEELPPVRTQYKDFAHWQNGEKQSETIKKQETYWINRFTGEVPVMNIPTDYPRPPVKSFEGNHTGFNLGEKETKLLKRIALEEGVTLYMLLLSIYTILLSKLTGQEDIVIGSPIAGRRHADLEKIIGMFVNTLLMRNFPRGGKSFRRFLREVKQAALEAFENQEYQFEDLVEQVALNRDIRRNPLVDVMFVLQNISGESRNISQPEEPLQREKPGAAKQYYKFGYGVSKFDITLFGSESGDNLAFSFEYSPRLFKKETIQRFIAYFKIIASSISKNIEKKICDIEIISQEEKRQVLYDFNDTKMEYPAGKTIHQLFTEQAERTPDRIAAVGQSAKRSTQSIEERDKPCAMCHAITYRELNQKSGRLARILQAKGVKPNSMVAVMVERSLEMIIGIIGILKAGGAYLPVAPGYPGERKKIILKDSAAKILLTRDTLIDANKELPHSIPPGNVLSIENPDHWAEETLEIKNLNKPTDLLYVVYTSGSTGMPKGVLITHGGIVNLVHIHRDVFGENHHSQISQVADMSFDAMSFEIWPSLISGAALYIANDNVRRDPCLMKKWLIDNQITISYQPTVMAEYLLKEEWPEKGVALRALRAAGERLTKYPAHLYPFKLYNLYGPTEDTVWTTWTEVKVKAKHEKYPTIGKPIGNHHVYVVSCDGAGKLQPIGVPGELCIGGKCLARGYLNNPELTAERFRKAVISHSSLVIKNFKRAVNSHLSLVISSPPKLSPNDQCPMTNDRLYFTGDLARWQADGEIEFIGRIDHQVKLRGFRIELGEIESRLLKHERIKEAVVLARGGETDDRYLCAYIVLTTPKDEPLALKGQISSGLRIYLSGYLPGYMIPTHYIQLEKIPLTPSGKIDRKGLPDPGISASSKYAAPRDEVEKKLIEIWKGVLGINISRDAHRTAVTDGSTTPGDIGIDDDFFGLGGHSLKATILVSNIQKAFKIRVPLLEIFKIPTIRHQAEYIKKRKMENEIFISETEVKDLVLLRGKSENADHLFLVHDGTGEVDGYIEFCKRLNSPFNYWGLRVDGLGNPAPQNWTIEQLARKYVGNIKKIREKGPYYLVGWSLGGTIAFEMARQLEQVGEECCFLALIDTPAPQRNNLKSASEFTLESELIWLRHYLTDSQIYEKLKDAPGIDKMWHQLVDYLVSNHFDLEIIKRLIPGGMARAIPNYNQLGMKELIYYLNMARTLDNAINRYIPTGKSKVKADFFEASLNEGCWGSYLEKPLTSHTIIGDHFSIFKIPDVIEFAKRFDSVLEEAKNAVG